MYVHGIRALFRFEGYVVQKITMSSEIVQVNLRCDGRRTLRCPACGGRMNVHRTLTQTARDLPLGTAMQVVVTYPAIQGRCKACGGFCTVRPGGIDEHARATRRLMEFVSRRCRVCRTRHNRIDKGDNMNETRIRKGTIMNRTTALGLLGLACLMAMPSIAHARYRDGMNLYQYVQSRPTVARDPTGLTTVIPTFDDGPASVDWQEPGKCPANDQQMLADLNSILGTLKRKKVKAVFYVLFPPCDPKCPQSPKGSMQGRRRVFKAGVQAIHRDGHVIALHAYNHGLYRRFGASVDDINSDLNRLKGELSRAGVPYKDLWRAPYGGYKTLVWEWSCVAPGQGLTFRRWDIDSEDWTYHWDNDDKGQRKKYLNDPRAWLENVEENLRSGVFWAGGEGSLWADILFHVNSRTASNLPHLMKTVEDEYRKVYGADKWGPGKEFNWSTNVNSKAFQDYTGG